MDTYHIKQCPHCEGKCKVKKDIFDFYYVECGNCGCRTRGTVTKEEAVRVWNRRRRGEQTERKTEKRY